MSHDRGVALRFALTRDRRLALWRGADGGELAGLAEWRGGAVRLDEPQELARLDQLAAAAGAPELPGWAVRLLAAHGAPCRLRALERVFSGGGPGGDAERTQPIPAQSTPGTDFDTLAAYVDGTLAAERRVALDALVASDAALRARVEELRALSSRLAAKRAPARPGPPPPPPPPPATSETASWRGAWIALGAAVGLAVLVGLVALVVRAVGGAPEASTSTPPPGAETAAVEPPARPRAELYDGERRIAVDAAGALEGLGGISVPLERRILRALLDGELPTPEGLAELAAPPPALPAERETPPAELLEPRATRVLEERPVFRFRLGEGVRGARVRVVDLAGREVASSAELRGATREWTPEQRLPRGRALIWQLELNERGAGRSSWPATLFESPRFELVRVDELAYAERELAAARGSRLAAALLYAELGALDDARSALDDLARDNPGAPLVGRLSGALRRARPEAAGVAEPGAQ